MATFVPGDQAECLQRLAPCCSNRARLMATHFYVKDIKKHDDIHLKIGRKRRLIVKLLQ